MAKKILSSDFLITDNIIHLDQCPQAAALFHALQLDGKSKVKIDRGQLDAFRDALKADHYSPRVVPGGSSANTLTTLGKLLGDEMSITFMGVVGDSEQGKVIKQELADAGITLYPPSFKEGQVPEEATSLVFLDDKAGMRTIATYPGNAKELLTPDYVRRDMVEASDVLFVQGSLWQKLQETETVIGGHAPEDQLGFADRMLRFRKPGTKLWLSMPTHGDYSTMKKTHDEQLRHYQWLMPSADLILGNDEEIARVFTSQEQLLMIERTMRENNIAPHVKPADITKAKKLRDPGKLAGGEAETIRAALAEKNLTPGMIEAFLAQYTDFDYEHKTILPEEGLQRLKGVFEKSPHEGQVAFVTCGESGAVVIRAGHENAPIKSVKPKEIRNTGGAGDTSFAFFIAGMENGLDPVESANIAMAMASKKIEIDVSRLPDPRSALKEAGLHSRLVARHEGASPDPSVYEASKVGGIFINRPPL